MLQITSILDELLGTELAVQFGADLTALSSSSNYRDQLKYIFTVDWLNPLLGLGRKRSFKSEINGSFIESVDNFYIAEYVRYAYPGMITYLLFLGSMIAGDVYKRQGVTLRRRLHSNNVTMHKMRDLPDRVRFLEDLKKSHEATLVFAESLSMSERDCSCLLYTSGITGIRWRQCCSSD